MSRSISAQLLAAKASKAAIKLDNVAREAEAPGFEANWHGLYWPKIEVDRIIAMFDAAVVSASSHERASFLLLRAAFLKNALRLTQAAHDCSALLDAEPRVKFPAKRLLAEIHAFAGNHVESKLLADDLISDPLGSFFRISDDEIDRIRKCGQEVLNRERSAPKSQA